MADSLEEECPGHREWEDEVKQQQQQQTCQHSSGSVTHKASLSRNRCDAVQVAVSDAPSPAISGATAAFRGSHTNTNSVRSTNASTLPETARVSECRLGHREHAGHSAAQTCSSKHHYREHMPRLRSTGVLSADASGFNPPSVSALTPLEMASASPPAEFRVSAPCNAAAPPPLSPSFERSATLAMPFTPYPVQQEMGSAITDVLHSSSPHVVPVAVAEVPTGCGKTMALLSSVLRYQQELKRKSPHELDLYLRPRRPPWQQQRLAEEKRKVSPKCRGGLRGPRQRAAALSAPCVGGDQVDECCDGWSVPPWFFKHFRVNSERKIRAELDVTASQALRRRFLPPPCTVYYVTRTHAQLRQAVRELRRLHGAATAIRMNILGSRERYCIHPKVMHAKANHTLPVEGNNLGEVCDKLVSMGLCEMVDKYDELSCSAIAGPIGHQRGQIWDIEDLVLEGTSRHMCPYYAARDLVFFADVNFCTYPYLLDPLIRHETKMEAALKNNAIVVFDEAHNVAAVCQDALSLECPRGVLALILSELEPLVSNQMFRTTQAVSGASSATPAVEDGFATMQYPKELHLGSFTLDDIICFLCALFRSLSVFFDGAAEAAKHREERGGKRCRGDEKPWDERNGRDGGAAYLQGCELDRHLRSDMEAHVTAHQQRTSGLGRCASTTPSFASLELFQRAYGVIMALGVTFNPFLFSIFGLSMLKRWLLVLRFLFQRPQSFAVALRLAPSLNEPISSSPGDSDTHRSLFGEFSAAAGVAQVPPRPDGGSGVGCMKAAAGQGTIDLRCLDGSLAFSHLLRTVHRVVLASGTLSPFTQLARDLGVEASLWRTVEGLHVVPPTQYSIAALTTLPEPSTTTHNGATTKAPPLPLRCTYTSLSNPVFLRAVAHAVVQLTEALRESGGGGVLFFVPNYAVLASLSKLTREAFLAVRQDHLPSTAAPVQLFLEPRKAEALTAVLSQFQSCTQAPRSGTALFFSVYRGKVSEGLDFTDDMARLVLCLGLPLQPLRSWRVIAQRDYSGPEWYVTDAVRAVNQALGRCLRHVQDYGAVVLLDERYTQPVYQQRLSKWCRAAIQTEVALPQLCARLQMSFTQWRGAFRALTSGPVASPTPSAGTNRAEQRNGVVVAAQQDPVNPARARLGTERLPFTRVQRALPATSQSHRSVVVGSSISTAEPLLHKGGTTCVVRSAPDTHKATRHTSTTSDDLFHSPLACTAVKLLYEAADATGDVSRKDLQDAIQSLTSNFFDDSGSERGEGDDKFE